MCPRHSCSKHKRKHVATIATAAYLGQALLSSPLALPGVSDASSAWSNVLAATLAGQAHAAEANVTDAADTVKWTCPMHPHYIAAEFGACPICGMDLVKLETGASGTGPLGAERRPIVTIAPEVMQNIGVRLGRAETVSFGRSIRSFGLVEENERLVSDISARVEGWAEQLSVTAVGDEVKQGQLLFKVYSPRLLVSQKDYILYLDQPGRARAGLRQLKSYGVQDRVIEELEKTREPMDLVPFFAEQTGTVAELNLKEGGYLDRGMLLARIQDYRSVWLIVGVAEKDLGFISNETAARVTFPSLPDREINATVDYIYPTVDPETRTGRVRLVIDNKDGLVRPGSYADVTFDVGTKERIAVPSEAVLKNADGRHIVVSLGEGRFEPRKVRTGLISDGWTEVLAGLDGGEDIVVSGQFLIDSESALRESFRKLERLQLPLSLLAPTESEFAMIDHMVDAALYIHEALVDGYDLEPNFLDAAISIRDLLWPRYGRTQLGFVLDDAVAAIKQAQQARTTTEVSDALGRLVDALKPWIMEGAPGHYQGKQVVMFSDALDRHWLQIGARPFNPFGSEPAEAVPYPAEPASPTETTGVDAAGLEKGAENGS